MVVQVDPVRQRAVGEIVAMRVQFVQVAQGPQRAPGLDPQPVGQSGAGQGADIDLLQIEFGLLARMCADPERERAVELVVDVARQGHFGVPQAQAFGAALSVMAEPEAGDVRFVGGKRRGPSVEDDADRRVEGVVGRRGAARRRRRRGRGGLRPDLGELLLERADALFVFASQRLDFVRQLGCRFGLRPRRRRGEQNRTAGGEQRAYGNGSHPVLLIRLV